MEVPLTFQHKSEKKKDFMKVIYNTRWETADFWRTVTAASDFIELTLVTYENNF